MIIYESSVGDLINRYRDISLYDDIEQNFKEKIKNRPSSGEELSWRKSLPKIIEIVKMSNVSPDAMALIEFTIPSINYRIDLILCGKDNKDNDNAIVIELKQWENVKSTTKYQIVKTNVGDKTEMLHPSAQVLSYTESLTNVDDNFNKINITPIVYAHNYKGVKGIGLEDNIYKSLTDKAPVFHKNNETELIALFDEKLKGGSSKIVYETFRNISWNPSKSLVENAKSANNELKYAFNNIKLFGDQISAFNTIVENIDNTIEPHKKNVFIISGSAGTGKTILAFKIFLNYLEKMNIGLILPGGDFRQSMVKLFNLKSKKVIDVIGKRIIGQPSKPNFKDKQFDAVIVDESHKLHNNSSTSSAKPIDDIFNCCKTIILFYDEKQIVHKKSMSELTNKIKKISLKENDWNVTGIDLTMQFRNYGGNEYMQWINGILYKNLELSDKFINSSSFKMNICKSEDELLDKHKYFYKKNTKSNHTMYKTRILSMGTSFEWTREITNGSLYKDIFIGNKRFTWYLPQQTTIRKNIVEGLKKLSTQKRKEINHDFNMDDLYCDKYVGYHNTVQGSEFFHTSVFVGEEFYLNDDGEIDFDISKAAKSSKDSFYKQSEVKQNKIIALNQFKVLLTRATSEISIYFKDKRLRDLMIDKVN